MRDERRQRGDGRRHPAFHRGLAPDEGEVGPVVSGRTARNERRLEEDFARIAVRIADARQERLEGGRGDFPDGLGDRGERRLGRPGEGDVIKADDGDILRDALADLAKGCEDLRGAFVVSADDGVDAGFAAENGREGFCIGRREIERTDTVRGTEQGEFAGKAEETVVPVGVSDVSLVFAEEGDLPVAALVEMVGDAAPGVDVVNGDEVAVAAFRGTGDVRVDQHDRDLRPPANSDDLPVRCGERLVDVGTEDDAFRAGDGEFAHLVPDVPDGGFMVPLAGEDEPDRVVETFAMTFEFILDVREELEGLEVGDDESDDAALAEGAAREERSRAVAFLDEPLALQFGERPAHRHARGGECIAEIRFARQFPVLRELPRGDLPHQLLVDVPSDHGGNYTIYHADLSIQVLTAVRGLVYPMRRSWERGFCTK